MKSVQRRISKHLSAINNRGGDPLKAVIDRFEGDYAVLLFGDDEVKVDIPRALLPTDAREGSWLKVTFETDHDTTRERKERISGLLDKLKNKNK